MEPKTYIYVNAPMYKAYGVRVIVDKLQQYYNGTIVHDIDSIPSTERIVPYGLLESYKLSKHSKNLSISVLVDAYSLGQLSNLKEFIKYRYIPFAYTIKHLLRFVKYLFYEYCILKKYKTVILVSYGDLEYYKRNWITRRYADKVKIIQNGVSIPDNMQFHKKENKFVVGCLSAWTGGQAFYNLKVFLNEVWLRIPKEYSCSLLIAGRGLTEEMKSYISNFDNINIMGEVSDLSEFYKQVDASLVPMFKKCGIINRVLDGFSYKVPVITRPENLLAFCKLPDCAYEYTDIDSFLACIDQLVSNPEASISKTEQAFEYIKKYHDWDVNYMSLADL